MYKSLSKLSAGIVIAVIMFAGMAAFGPTNAGSVFGSQKAAAAGCTTNYYRITAQSVSVRQDPNWGGAIIATFTYGQTVTGIHGGVNNGWTQVNAWGAYGPVRGYIPDQYRTYLTCY